MVDGSPPSPERLLELVDGMTGQPVVMLVDLVADRFITGTPKRISREAPVLILSWESDTLIPGGGANAVANVAALGGRPLVLGAVGDDDSGRGLLEDLARRGVETESILIRPAYRTPTKTRILGGARHAIKQQIVRFDVEDTLEHDDAVRRHVLASLDRWRGRARAAVVSDYGYGAAVPELLPEMRARLGADCPILGDSRYRLGALRGLDGATPNLEEAEHLLERPLDAEDAALPSHGDALRARLEARFLLITLGSQGMLLLDGSHWARLPVHGTDQVADVTGAGDTVIGTFALSLAAGATPLEAACLANYAGGIVVRKMGTATLDQDELRSAIAHDPELLEEIRWDVSSNSQS